MKVSISALLFLTAAAFGQISPSQVYTASWTSATAANSVLQEATASYNAALVTFAQTSTLTAGSAVFEGSDTPTASPTDNWYPVSCRAPKASGTAYGFTASTYAAFQCNVVGFQRFRVRLYPAITGTGTVAVSLQFTSVGAVNPQPGYSVNQTFVIQKSTTLSAAAEVITIQQPASGGKEVQFISGYFDCTVACSVTLERNGTAATTTTLSNIQNLNPVGPPATVTAFSSSNVGTGTVLGSYNCAAACSVPLDLSGIQMAAAGGTGTNLTLRSSSITGTVDVIFKLQEQQ